MESDARYHVVSFTYIIPALLKADKHVSSMLGLCWNCADAACSRIEILDFDRFKFDLLTPDTYVDTVKDVYDAGGEADECPSYMIIYEIIHSTCKEQRSIVDNGLGLFVLSSTFGALPRLMDVGLSFCEAIEGEDWLLSSLTSDMTVAEESYKYHVRAISNALQLTRADLIRETIPLQYKISLLKSAVV